MGIIGVGAFGAFAARHLAQHFDLVLCDPKANVEKLAREIGARAGDLSAAAGCDVVVLAVPVQKMRAVLAEIAPKLKQGALVVDVASVKIRPASWMEELVPAGVSIVGTHPLFGPQSGKQGVKGLNIAICDIRGGRGDEVALFCAEKLALRIFRVTPETHDRELAYVHGLTHMIGKVIVLLGLPEFKLTTKTYELLDAAVDYIRDDSDELFQAIQSENPYANEAKAAFFDAAKKLEKKLAGKD